MNARADAGRSGLPTATGVAVGLAGVTMTGFGLLARADVRRSLARERIVSDPDANPPQAPVTTAVGVRSLAELIRQNTLESTRGQTYAEIQPYLDAEGLPTAAAERAARDAHTGSLVENPDHALWIESTTLQTALMQAYVAFRLSELTAALGVAFTAVGFTLVVLGRRSADA